MKMNIFLCVLGGCGIALCAFNGWNAMVANKLVLYAWNALLVGVNASTVHQQIRTMLGNP